MNGTRYVFLRVTTYIYIHALRSGIKFLHCTRHSNIMKDVRHWKCYWISIRHHSTRITISFWKWNEKSSLQRCRNVYDNEISRGLRFVNDHKWHGARCPFWNMSIYNELSRHIQIYNIIHIGISWHTTFYYKTIYKLKQYKNYLSNTN